MKRPRFPCVVEWIPDPNDMAWVGSALIGPRWSEFNRYADPGEANRRAEALRRSGFEARVLEVAA